MSYVYNFMCSFSLCSFYYKHTDPVTHCNYEPQKPSKTHPLINPPTSRFCLRFFLLRLCKFLPLQLPFWGRGSGRDPMPECWAWADCPAWADRPPATATRRRARATTWTFPPAATWAAGGVGRSSTSYPDTTSRKRAESRPS